MRMRGMGILAGTVLFTLATCAVSFASTRARFRAETVLNDPAVRLAVGTEHACQINEDGTVRCWGSNSLGQLGNGDMTPEPQPTPVLVKGIGGLNPAVAISAGNAYTCAVLHNGTVRCWGFNGPNGLLGDGTNTPQPVPVTVSGVTGAVGIEAGIRHTCALLSNGGVRCWGDPQVAQITGGIANAVGIAVGDFHTCALLADGTARCWGFNGNGELGNGTTSTTVTTIPQPVSGLANAVAITAGIAAHTCALLADGTARCWGSNSSGQLGDNSDSLQQPSPVAVVGLDNAVAISAGAAYTCALLADGTARCWGQNRVGELGDGTGQEQPTPVAVNDLRNAVAITAGNDSKGSSACALLADGSARCWGKNDEGQLGDGAGTSFSTTPTFVSGGGGSVTARDVAAGRNHTCAVRANSTVACWGSDASGQLGDGATGVNRLKPVAVTGLTNAVAVAGGDAHTCALLADGTIRCWGLNSSGQLGNGGTATQPRPVAVQGLTNAVALATGGALGGSHTCALLADSTVRCWGANSAGQLGDGTTNPSSIPVLVKNLFNAVAIAAGEFHACALLANGTVRCWGANGSGQLGDGSLGNAGTNAVTIASGSNHNCVLRADGIGRCWGSNLLGQLGNGTTTSSQSAPATVSNLSNAVAIAGGFGHSCASLADGTARCWGDNAAGQLGNPTIGSLSKTPVTVGKLIVSLATFFSPLRSVVNLTTGRRHSCALGASGFVSCWGENTFGQLGNDSTTNSNVPVGVPSFTLNIDPAVTLQTNGRVTTVTVLAVCEEGQLLHANVTLTQGSVSGRGIATGECTGGLTQYAAIVPAQGRDQFIVGPAVVAAEATIQDGSVAETQEWTREVSIVNARRMK